MALTRGLRSLQAWGGGPVSCTGDLSLLWMWLPDCAQSTSLHLSLANLPSCSVTSTQSWRGQLSWLCSWNPRVGPPVSTHRVTCVWGVSSLVSLFLATTSSFLCCGLVESCPGPQCHCPWHPGLLLQISLDCAASSLCNVCGSHMLGEPNPSVSLRVGDLPLLPQAYHPSQAYPFCLSCASGDVQGPAQVSSLSQAPRDSFLVLCCLSILRPSALRCPSLCLTPQKHSVNACG